MNRSKHADGLFEALARKVDDTFNDYQRLPGLHRPWELEDVIRPGTSYLVEDGGRTSEGTPLFVVYRERPDGPSEP